MVSETVSGNAYEMLRWASLDRLRDLWRAGKLTRKQIRTLLARKDYGSRQITLLLKGWE